MPKAATVAQAFDELADVVPLAWVAGTGDGSTPLRNDEETRRTRLIGALNFNSANRVQLIGPAEARIFAAVENLDPSRFEYSLSDKTDVFLISDNLPPPPALRVWAAAHRIPMLVSTLAFGELQQSLRYHMSRRLAEQQIIHGVMMDVYGTGVLITGEASIGKSEVALELISRGHILVADDAPEFTRLGPDTIEGHCPPLLQGFLHVSGLGVLNIARMYGANHTHTRKILKFTIRLLPVKRFDADGANPKNDRGRGKGDQRLRGLERVRTILGVTVPERVIPVAPGRNLAVLVEAAVRDQHLQAGGYSAVRDFIDQQAGALEDAQ